MNALVELSIFDAIICLLLVIHAQGRGLKIPTIQLKKFNESIVRSEKRVIADSWNNGFAYNQFMGRWSKLVCEEFLTWFDAPSGQSWVDIGCGTGNLTRGKLENRQPGELART